jgi:hypothetical protein
VVVVATSTAGDDGDDDWPLTGTDGAANTTGAAVLLSQATAADASAATGAPCTSALTPLALTAASAPLPPDARVIVAVRGSAADIGSRGRSDVAPTVSMLLVLLASAPLSSPAVAAPTSSAPHSHSVSVTRGNGKTTRKRCNTTTAHTLSPRKHTMKVL